MGSQAEVLAAQLEAAIDEAAAAIEGCSDERWSALNAADGWSVGVTAHHIAGSVEGTYGLAQAIADSRPVPPITRELLDAGNARHAREFAGCTKAETVALLRGSSQDILAQLRALSDEQLARSADVPIAGGILSAGELIERVVVGHVRGHLANIVVPA
jgi:hypothetical protein